VKCPFCDSRDVEPLSQWGGQMITAQMRCRSCHTYFEAIRPDFDAGPEHAAMEPAARTLEPEGHG
jgi:hypothetical protein